MTDMDKMTMRDYAKRCGVTYECVRRTVNKELKNNPVFEKYVHKLGKTTSIVCICSMTSIKKKRA